MKKVKVFRVKYRFWVPGNMNDGSQGRYEYGNELTTERLLKEFSPETEILEKSEASFEDKEAYANLITNLAGTECDIWTPEEHSWAQENVPEDY
ncbi:MAG: hypothetical protein WC959_12355 [Kiritimatiellales bacterium]